MTSPQYLCHVLSDNAYSSLEPRLSVPDFVSQTKSGTESLGRRDKIRSGKLRGYAYGIETRCSQHTDCISENKSVYNVVVI